MWRWLAADPREVVDLVGAGALAGGAEAPQLEEELRHWRGVVARRRLVALTRRHAAVALGLAAVLEILSLLDAFPQWVVVAVPLAGFAVSVAIFAARGPSPFALARLLDDKLGLNDRLATALEIEARAGGSRSSLEQRTVDDAAALLRAGREDWQARPARAGRADWTALAGVVAALAAVVAIGLVAGGSSSSGPTEALAPKGGRHGGGGKGAAAPNEYVRHAEKSRKGRARTPREVKAQQAAAAAAQEAAKAGYQKIPQGSHAGKEGEVKAGGKSSGKAGGPHSGSGSETRKGAGAHSAAGEEERAQGKRPTSTSRPERKHPTVGFSVDAKKNHGSGGKSGASRSSGAAGAKKAAQGNQGAESSGAESRQGSSSAAGTSHAGGQPGTSRQGHAKPIKGQATQAVKIQPGYAPSRSSKGGRERRKGGDEQGAGGKARTAQVTGATQIGEEFSFVPTAGGAVPGPSAGLQQNYLESLKWVERLPW
jgi:hypothetical protein